MFRTAAGAFALVALGASLGMGGLTAQEDTFDWSGVMTAGQALTVKGIVGKIRAVPTSGDRAEVVARKRGSRGDFEEVAIEVEEVRDGFIICAVYGSWRHGTGHCQPDHRDREDEGRRHRHENIDVDVEYEVRVPAGVTFEGGMVSGDIDVRDLRSPVEANTVNGDIFVSTTETAWANTVSGDIEIEMGSLDWDDMDFNTVSGDITLWLPEDLGADIRFQSISGDLDTDFDLTLRGRQGRRWIGSDIRGTIGGGGRDLSFHTVSGNVDLRRK